MKTIRTSVRSTAVTTRGGVRIRTTISTPGKTVTKTKFVLIRRG